MDVSWCGGVGKMGQLWAPLSPECFVSRVQKKSLSDHFYQMGKHIREVSFKSKGMRSKVIEIKWNDPKPSQSRSADLGSGFPPVHIMVLFYTEQKYKLNM